MKTNFRKVTYAISGGSLSAFLLFFVAIIGMVPGLAGAALTLQSNFESGNFSGWSLQINKTPSLLGTGRIVTSPRRAGSKAACFDLRRDIRNAPKRRRAEIHTGTGSKRPQFGKDYWYGWSVYLPSNWVFDRKISSIMGQWHLDNSKIKQVAGSQVGVPVSFSGSGTNLKVYLNGPQPRKALYSASYTDMKGKWTDFVTHAKWSSGGDGILEIWKNGRQIVNFRGPTSSRDPSGGPYFKIGIYKPEWKFTSRPGDTNQVSICYDEVRVAGPSGSYKEVAPHGAAKAGSSAPVQKALAAATKQPVAKKKSTKKKSTKKKSTTKKKRKINIKTCNKHKGTKRKKCRRRVINHNKSLKK